MRRSVALRSQMRDAIRQDIEQRTSEYQAAIARLRTGTQTRAMLMAANPAVPAAQQPLVMLANGDSWFDYPLSGNDPSLRAGDQFVIFLDPAGSPAGVQFPGRI